MVGSHGDHGEEMVRDPKPMTETPYLDHEIALRSSQDSLTIQHLKRFAASIE